MLLSRSIALAIGHRRTAGCRSWVALLLNYSSRKDLATTEHPEWVLLSSVPRFASASRAFAASARRSKVAHQDEIEAESEDAVALLKALMKKRALIEERLSSSSIPTNEISLARELSNLNGFQPLWRRYIDLQKVIDSSRFACTLLLLHPLMSC